LYAKWTPVVTYNLSYELNGGTNNTENPKTYKTGDTVSLAFPERADYMFAGWYTDSALTNEIKEIKDREESLTLYAKWILYDEVFEFTLSDGEYIVSDFMNNASTVIIPSTYKNLPVTGISDYAFSFNGLLKRIAIPDSIIEIGHHSFYKCESLEYIILPDSVVSIGTAAFSECNALKRIDVESNNKYYQSIDGVLYSIDGKTLVAYPNGNTKETYTIPNGTETMEAGVFAFNTYLKSVTIPDTVKVISSYAFFKCISLENAVIPNSVTQIGNSAFYECTSLKSLIISNKVEVIGYDAFSKCSALESVVIPGSVKTVGWRIFSDCSSLKSVTIEDGATTIGTLAFANCTSLTSIEIPSSVTILSLQVFEDCTSLKNITIPDSITSIENGVFHGCTSLEILIIPDSVATLEAGTFNFCNNLTVYCEAEEKPEGWSSSWDHDVKEVVWGYKEEQ
ncbi:MAG: leucine-rich repeat protein, partial [Clostridia bacterium]|nr:leucine-rich repeat protein [Clostridia bacterium]